MKSFVKPVNMLIQNEKQEAKMLTGDYFHTLVLLNQDTTRQSLLHFYFIFEFNHK